MPKTRTQKEEQVKSLSEKLGRAKSVVFADYKGLTMAELSDLRNKLSEISSEFTITKNSLMDLALKENEQKLNTGFEGPTATLFAYDDEITPIKLLVKTLKDTGKGQVKTGFLGNDLLDAVKIQQLSTLPSKDELRSKVVGVLMAPLQGMASVLQGNLRNLVYTLSEIKRVRGGV